MGLPQDTGHGTDIEFATSGWVANIVDSSHSGANRGAVDSTHLKSTAPVGGDEFGGMEYIPAKVGDPGSLNLTVQVPTGLKDATEWLPLNQPKEVITVTLPVGGGDSVGAKFQGDGFMTDGDITYQTPELVQADVTIKCSGVWKQIPSVV